MKRIFTFLLLLLALKSNAQSTWIERLIYSSHYPYYYADSVCGVLNASVGADGNLYILGKTLIGNEEQIIKMPMNGGVFLWAADAGYHATLNAYEAVCIRATADSGCMLLKNHRSWANDYYINSSLEKYSASGTLQWTHTFNHTSSSPYKTGYDAILNSSGNYYVLVADSLFEIDNSGNVIFGTNGVSGRQLFELSGGDFLVRRDSSIIRTDLSGNVMWTFSQINAADIARLSEASVFVCEQGTQVTKIDVSTGSSVWSAPITSLPVSSIDATADGGVVIANGLQLLGSNEVGMDATLTKFDASGAQQWSKTYPLPRFGLSYVQQLPSGNYLVGGAYSWCREFGCISDYNGLAAVVDSSGSGPLETATSVWPGDVDLNDTLDFATDGALVGIAFGATGPPKDHQNFPAMILDPFDYWKDYAIDWPQIFGNGINYKHADFNGDGTIDSLDLNYWIGYGPFVIFCKESGESQTNTLPDFQLIPEVSTVLPGDTMRFFVVAGSDATPVNSLYDIASVLSYDGYLLDNSYAQVSGLTSDFGTPGVDMFAYNMNYLSGGVSSILFARTDQNNVTQLHDTIGIIELLTSNNIYQPTVFNLNISGLGAVTYDASHVAFNTFGASVLIDPTATSVQGVGHDPQIFPNPASQNLTVKTFSAGKKTFKITDVAGKEINQFESSQTIVHLSTVNLESGTYFLKVITDGSEKVSKFIIQR